MPIEYAVLTAERKRERANAVRRWLYWRRICEAAGFGDPTPDQIPEIEKACPTGAKVASQYVSAMDGGRTQDERRAIRQQFAPKRVAEPTHAELMARKNAMLAEMKRRLVSR